jgi:hypothetical protein
MHYHHSRIQHESLLYWSIFMSYLHYFPNPKTIWNQLQKHLENLEHKMEVNLLHKLLAFRLSE